MKYITLFTQKKHIYNKKYICSHHYNISLILYILFILISNVLFSCTKNQEVSRAEALNLQQAYASRILNKTVTKPGPPQYSVGFYGGNYSSTITSDIKSFNMIVIFDATTSSLVQNFFPYLFEYDAYKKQFTPHLAKKFTVEYDQEKDISYVYVTLRENVFWTTIQEKKAQCTSDDVIYWYNEVVGDKRLQMSAYTGQFITLADGSKKRIEIEKIDTYTFRFIIPRIVANPLLMVNMNFGPKYIYEKAKKEEGIQGLINALSIDTPPSEVPSIGPYVLTEYVPAQRIILTKNPHYWKLDSEDNALAYIEKKVISIAAENTSLLMLKNKEISGRTLSNSELDELITIETPHFTIYNAGTGLGSMFFSFNQNTDVEDEHKLRWFTSKKFRQAMSSAVPRQRIVNEVHRGLGEPALHFYAKANPFFNSSIQLKYTYNLDRAKSLLAEDGFYLKEAVLYDKHHVPVEFEIMMSAENKDGVDATTIFSQELEKLGITVTIRPLDFQNLVERLSTSYDWDAVWIGLGANYWPTGGINVWPSNGRLHLWHPLQETPATLWEAEIDKLYSMGKYTINHEKRQEIYDTLQAIMLEELPIIYTVHVNSFTAIDTNVKNVFIDNLQGSDSIYHFFQEQ